MQVQDIMTPHFECITQDAPISSVAKMMRELDVGMLPVEQDGNIVGTVTDRDITIRATAEGADPGDTLVGSIMSHDVFSCAQDSDIQDAAQIMEDHQVRRLLVRNSQGHYVGMLSLADLARHHEERLSAAILEEVSQPSTYAHA